MKVFGFLAIFIILTPSLQANTFCRQQNFNVRISKSVTARIGYFFAMAPQAALMFVQGPEKGFDASTSFIKNFCRKGFTVVAFDLLGEGNRRVKDPLLYKMALNQISHRLKQASPRLPMAVYAWSEGAHGAVRFAWQYPSKVKKLILESPKLDATDKVQLARLPYNKTRLFSCGFRSQRIATFKPLNRSACSDRLSSAPESQSPLLEFIESDFAGIPTTSWYWRRS